MGASKGIGSSLLIKAAQVTGRTIVSSVGEHSETEERRSGDANHMWKGMVARGQASYDEYEDRYRVLTMMS
jgi:hypothetical protein